MKVKNMLTMGCLALLTGCQQTDGLENQSEELPMYVEASIEEEPMSRYVSSDNSPNNLSFAVGDEIGLFVHDRSVVKWTKETEGWNPATFSYWPNKSDEYCFYAYYPYDEATSMKSVPMPSLAGQKGTIESLSACDFLVASSKESYDTDGVVSFTGNASFNHVSSLVAVTIKGDCDLKTSLINEISFSATDIATATTYSFDGNQVSKTGQSLNELVFSSLGANGSGIQMANKDEVLYFILNSGISLSNITFCIKYSTAGVNYKAEKANLGSGTLASGGRYNFNLSIFDGELSLSGGTIQNWGEGTPMEDIEINNPTVEEESGDEDA